MNRYSQTLTLRISPNANLDPVGRGELREAVEVELRRARRRPLPVDPLALAAVLVPAQGCQMAKFDPRKGRDQILQRSIAELLSRSPKGQTHTILKIRL